MTEHGNIRPFAIVAALRGLATKAWRYVVPGEKASPACFDSHRGRQRIVVSILVLTVALALQPLAGWAAWTFTHNGSGSTASTQVNRPAAPTVTKVGTTARVDWTQTTLAQGTPVASYTVRRYVGATTTVVCTVNEPIRTCVDSSPVQTTATYGVTAQLQAWTSTESVRKSFTFDTTAPVTTASSSPAPNGAGWNKTAPTLTLTATDSGSGVASITYKIGAAAAVTVNAATTNFTISAPGTTTITYFATDLAGNVESTKTSTVKLDNNAPNTVVSQSPAPNANGWNNTNTTITLTATEVGASGVASITYKIGAAAAVTVNAATASFTINTQGIKTFTYFATDVAGNVESTGTYTVSIDTQDPTADVDFPVNNGTYNPGQYNTGCAIHNSVCGSVADNLAVDRVVVGLYSFSRGECLVPPNSWIPCFDIWGLPSGSLPTATISGNTWRLTTGALQSGSYIVAIEAYDMAGNSVQTSYLTFTRS